MLHLGRERKSLNFDFTDTKERWMVEMGNGVQDPARGRRVQDADATLVPSRETLNQIVLKKTTLTDAAAAGTVCVTGGPRECPLGAISCRSGALR
jgi:alkyl sulfatase BDS1-like metallo-beta-lactamase superfamily hydrolase